MINVENKKVKEVINKIHEAMLRKVKKEKSINNEIVMENRLFSVLCHNFSSEPTQCAIEMNNKYGYNLNGYEVIQIFRKRRMGNPVERVELLEWANKVTEYFKKVIEGDEASFEKFEKIRKEPSLKNGKFHMSQERIVAIMIFEKYPEIDVFNDKENLYSLGNTLCKFFFYEMVDAISYVYGFTQDKDKVKNNTLQEKISYKQALQRISQLENTLERTNIMLQDLQDEFEEQLEESKIRELTDFFARLNSEKYGCILDELLVVKRGIDELRKKNYELPIEINGLLIMVKKLIQFVRDSHIEPIMKINMVKEVIAKDVEFCNYEGTPFISTKDTKKVKVVSPGWIYKDKNIQISRPKVKEEKEND